MISLLVDHNIERHGRLLWGQFSVDDWFGMGVARLAMLSDVQLSSETSDRDVWRFCQREGFLLLTANRNMDGDDSLEAVVRKHASAETLPILTLSDPDRVLTESAYRELCAYRIADISLDIARYRGTPRLYIP